MQPDRADDKAALLDRATVAIGGGATAAFFVPGRVELLGKHTDYAGGRSLLCAVEQGFCVAARRRADAIVRILAVDRREIVSCAWEAAADQRADDWANYALTVVRRLARNFPDARCGADIAFVSDIPAAAGLSSSSALMIAVFLALAEVNGLASRAAYRREIQRPEDLAGYVAAIENGRRFGGLEGDRGVGTSGGSEDHTAILCCRAGAASQYAFAPVRRERVVRFPAAHRLVIADSGVAAEKTGAARVAYNRASLAVEAILEVWHAATGQRPSSLDAAASADPGRPDRLRAVLRDAAVPGFTPQALLDRFEQFWQESTEFVPAAGNALDAGDLRRFGAIVDRSQEAAERQLGNQVAETIALQRLAREEGALAASAFGAGFGGSVWALVPESDVDRFGAAWGQRYRQAYPVAGAHARLITSHPGPPATPLLGESDLLTGPI